MRYKSILSIIALMILRIGGMAQNRSLSILQKTIEKIHSLKSISYETASLNKNPFSTGDTSFIKKQTSIVFNANGVIKAMNEKTTINNGQTKLREIYLDDSLYSMDLIDSTYSIRKKPTVIHTSLATVEELINKMIIDPAKSVQHKDTIIANIPCYHFFIKSYDAMEDNHHNYSNNTLLISKSTLMPILIKEEGAGIAKKGEFVLGRIITFNETRFLNFELNKRTHDSVFKFNQTNFTFPNDKMLPDGGIAPDLTLKDLNNLDVKLSDFKNKVLLVAFGSITCGANPLANPMLNRLMEKYNTKDFSIVSVYSEETIDQVKKYIESNNLKFPVYLGTKKSKKDFKIVGTPGFYLIDKNGKIIKSYQGFSDALEKNLEKKIDLLSNVQ